MNRPLICADCDELIDVTDATVYRIRECPACGSEEIGDASMDDIYRLLKEAKVERDAALKKMADAQMTAGAFQTEALLLKSELDSIKRRVAA